VSRKQIAIGVNLFWYLNIIISKIQGLMSNGYKMLGLFTGFQGDLLKRLIERENEKPPAVSRPRDLGAFRCSHHNKTLQSLTERGLVERVELARNKRPSFGYRITCEGSAAWREFISLAELPVISVLGKAADRTRAAATVRMAKN
jgi:hypothetical protein